MASLWDGDGTRQPAAPDGDARPLLAPMGRIGTHVDPSLGLPPSDAPARRSPPQQHGGTAVARQLAVKRFLKAHQPPPPQPRASDRLGRGLGGHLDLHKMFDFDPNRPDGAPS